MALTKIIIGPNSSGIADVQAGSGGGGSSAAPPQFSNQFNNPLGTLAGDSQQVWFPNSTPGDPGLLLLNSFDALVTPPVSGSFTPGFINYGHSAVGNFAAIDTITSAPGDTGGNSGTFAAPSSFIDNDFLSGDFSFITGNGVWIETGFNHTGAGTSGSLTALSASASVVTQNTGPISIANGLFGGVTNFGTGFVSILSALEFTALHSSTSFPGGDCGLVEGVFVEARTQVSSGGAFTGNMIGANFSVRNTGGTAGDIIGVQSQVSTVSFGTATNAYGFNLLSQGGSSPDNTAYGLFLGLNWGKTNSYGIVIDDWSEVNTGSTNDSFNIWSKGNSSINQFEGTITTGNGTVADLGTRFTAPTIGMRYIVTDATQTLTAGIGAIVAGTGANKVPVVYDGTNWRIG